MIQVVSEKMKFDLWEKTLAFSLWNHQDRTMEANEFMY